MNVHKKKRVAIVGGGCASLTAAYELSRPDHCGRYEVTVFQMGFRLGGKGASSRGVANRIEEHGLHLWLGFYENAFKLMRECYAELNRDPSTCRITTWQEAFEPAPWVAVVDRVPSGGWEPWVAYFPQGKGLPGDPIANHNPLSVSGYLRQAISLLLELLRSAAQKQGQSGCESSAPPNPSGPEVFVEAAERLLRYGQLATIAAIFEAADMLRVALGVAFPPPFRNGEFLMPLIDAIASAARRQLEMLIGGDRELLHIWEVVDLIITILRGATLFGLAIDPRGFDAINDYDWREWLGFCGANKRSLDSGFVRGIYDLVFAFEEGDVSRPRIAAGVALRGAMRMFFTYRGSLFWRMTAGMGEIVFSPLYETLRKRGVRFEFFHRLKNVKLAPSVPGENAYVEALEFDVQAKTKHGHEYHPFVQIDGLPCWPTQCLYDQLEDGDTLRRENVQFESPWETRFAGTKTLHVVEDFDFVVLGVPISVIPHVGKELIERSPRWRAMTEHVRSVATQSFQLWMREDTEELGWRHPPVNLSGYVEPFDTWADMSHLIGAEGWSKPIGSIAYFCSVLPDATPPGMVRSDEYVEAMRQVVRGNSIRFLSHDIKPLWPKAVAKDGSFRWEILASELDGTPEGDDLRGEKRFDTQYWTANVNPSERYTLSLPGTIKYRISPLDMTFDNLTIAGDWTQSGLDSGCIESAVMSGKLAAHALSGSPALSTIIGYDHP